MKRTKVPHDHPVYSARRDEEERLWLEACLKAQQPSGLEVFMITLVVVGSLVGITLWNTLR